MNNVAVPREYFVKTACRDYENPKAALIREFLQNSRDAGATFIDFKITSSTLICEDNGCGMDIDTIQNKLMALGETSKGNESTGGFGIAKILLFFAHDSYTIKTRDLVVTGSGGSYTITSGNEYVRGVIAEVKLCKDILDCNTAGLGYWAKQAIQSSYLPFITITINDDLVNANFKQGRKVEDMGSGITIHKRKSNSTRCYASVRVRGLHMFNLFMGESKYDVHVELDGYSTEILTTNRDSFRGEYRAKIESFVQSMALNSAATNESRVCLYKGEYSRKSEGLEELLNRVNEAFSSVDDDLGKFEAIMHHEIEAALSGGVDPEIVEKVKKKASERVEAGDTFLLTVKDLGLTHHYFIETIGNFRKVPKAWEPHNFKGFQLRLLELWAQVVSMTLKDAGSPNTLFDVGFVLDDGTLGDITAAKYRTKNDGTPVFLLNPNAYGSENKLPTGKARRTELVLWLMDLAAHEVTHHKGQSLHNESFIYACADIRQKMNVRFADYLKLAKA